MLKTELSFFNIIQNYPRAYKTGTFWLIDKVQLLSKRATEENLFFKFFSQKYFVLIVKEENSCKNKNPFLESQLAKKDLPVAYEN